MPAIYGLGLLLHLSKCKLSFLNEASPSLPPSSQGGGGGPATELTNTVSTQGPGAHFRARVQGT